MESLRTSTRGPKVMSNIINYDTLSNQSYADQFFYQYMERRVENESSDMVAKILYMGEYQLRQEKLKMKTNLKFLNSLKTAIGDKYDIMENSLFDVKPEDLEEENLSKV